MATDRVFGMTPLMWACLGNNHLVGDVHVTTEPLHPAESPVDHHA
jgi:hypothetical protein